MIDDIGAGKVDLIYRGKAGIVMGPVRLGAVEVVIAYIIAVSIEKLQAGAKAVID